MKKIIISIICSVIIILGVINCSMSFFYKWFCYPQSFIVSDIDYKNNIVYIATPTGFIYSFYNVDDWIIGDHCAAIMFNNYTKYIIDDKIISVKYCGF